ncbi:MAG: ion channel [Bacteroidota bacterium]
MKFSLNPTSIHNIRYELLLIALMFMMFNSLIFPPEVVRFAVAPFAAAFTYLSGALLFAKDPPRIRYPYYIFLLFIYAGTIYFVIEALHTDFRQRNDIAILQGLYFLYWVILLWKLILKIFRSQRVSLNMIFASVSGFVALIFMGATLFGVIEHFNPNSFPGMDMSNPNIFDEYIYFSFITQSSIGFGEITPGNPVAKKGVILMGTLGQFYLIILVGLIVSKYASSNKEAA